MMLHYISITWKLICAIIPPADWAGAYPTFVGSLVILVGIIFLTKEVGVRASSYCARACLAWLCLILHRCLLWLCACFCLKRLCACVASVGALLAYSVFHKRDASPFCDCVV